MSVNKTLFNTTTIPLLEKIAAFTARRHDVLAGNIANIDTPNYHMRDLPIAEFQQALAKVADAFRDARTHQTESPNATSAQPNSRIDLDEIFPASLFRAGDAATNNVTFQDGGNRSVEQEVMEMTKNAMMQKYALEVMMAQMNLLQSMISERA